MVEGYQEDLAYIHDVGFGAFSSESAPGLLEILRQKGIAKGLVVDLGCGSGIWAKALTQVAKELRKVGFKVRIIRGYGNLNLGMLKLVL